MYKKLNSGTSCCGQETSYLIPFGILKTAYQFCTTSDPTTKEMNLCASFCSFLIISGLPYQKMLSPLGTPLLLPNFLKIKKKNCTHMHTLFFFFLTLCIHNSFSGESKQKSSHRQVSSVQKPRYCSSCPIESWCEMVDTVS